MKVLRPASATIVATDMSLLRPFVRWLARTAPIGMLPAVPETVDGLAEQLAEELDLRNEARAMHWFNEMIGLIGPRGSPCPTRCSRPPGSGCSRWRYIDGAKIDDLAALAAERHRRPPGHQGAHRVVVRARRCAPASFHGDMHAGNLLLTGDGRGGAARLGHRRSPARAVAGVLPSLARGRPR